MVAESCPVTVSENPVQREEGPLNGGGNHDPLKVNHYKVALTKSDYMLENLSIQQYLQGKNLIGADNQQGSRN